MNKMYQRVKRILSSVFAVGRVTARGASGSKEGFTLIEVALALLVVAIGVLAVFSLLTAGLNFSAKASEDTQAAIFADNVLHGIRSMSLEWARQQNETNKWLIDHAWPATKKELLEDCFLNDHNWGAKIHQEGVEDWLYMKKNGKVVRNQAVSGYWQRPSKPSVWERNWAVSFDMEPCPSFDGPAGSLNYWSNSWRKLESGQITIPGSWVVGIVKENIGSRRRPVWVDTLKQKEIIADGGYYPYYCTNWSFRTNEVTGIMNHGLRYQIGIDFVTTNYVWDGTQYARGGKMLEEYTGYYFDFWKDEVGGENYGDVDFDLANLSMYGTNTLLARVEVTLKVWPGEFGNTNKQNPLVYYSEFSNPGDF